MLHFFRHVECRILHWAVLLFWTLFWYLNVLDKFIGGKIPLWVGKDRIAQFVKFFYSIGVESAAAPISALVAGTILETSAFVFLLAAIFFLIKEDHEESQKMLFWGSVAGLLTFSFFAIGDQIFGDRFELLEHTIFWVAILVSFGIYRYFPEDEKANKKDTCKTVFTKSFNTVVSLIIVLSVISSYVVIKDSLVAIDNAPKMISPVEVTAGIYRFDIPFISNRKVWENSLIDFKTNNPRLDIKDIYTAPNELKSKADNVVIYVVAE